MISTETAGTLSTQTTGASKNVTGSIIEMPNNTEGPINILEEYGGTDGEKQVESRENLLALRPDAQYILIRIHQYAGENDHIDLVPKSWIYINDKSAYCAYPAVVEEEKITLWRQERRNPEDSWPWFEVEILKQKSIFFAILMITLNMRLDKFLFCCYNLWHFYWF